MTKFLSQETELNALQELLRKTSLSLEVLRADCLPVLFHVNGVTDSVLGSEYFSLIIDFGKLLE